MIQLTTNVSDPLLELIRSGEALVDGVEVGPWASPRQIREYRQALPGMPFFFHAMDLIGRVGLVPGTLARIEAYLAATESPWLSAHIPLWLPGMVRLMLRYGWRMPLPDPDRATRRAVRQVRSLAGSVHIPVILENNPPLPFDGYDFEARTERITTVLQETGCGLLLDLGHARVAAAELGMDAPEYVQRLPLARVAQVHVSGPRLVGGRLVDAHEPLQAADYELLRFVLARTAPSVITLEYIRERQALCEQLHRLRVIVDAHR